MAVITDKKIHELARMVSNGVPIAEWVSYGRQIKLAPKDVALSGSEVNQWFTILKAADDKSKLIEFLDAMLIKYAHEEQLKSEVEDLKKGYSPQLESIVKAIKARECILFLGPGVLVINGENSNKTFNEMLAGRVAILLDENNKYYDNTQRDNISYMIQRYKKTVRNNAAEIAAEAIDLYEYYSNKYMLDTLVMDQLAKIPWKLVINTNPDNILASTMNSNNKDSCLVASYTLENNGGIEIETTKPAENQCMVYNLFGSFENPSSILYTNADFLRFNSTVTGDVRPLNDYVMRMFDMQKKYLFLGFDFDQWYFKILFNRILELNVDQQSMLSLHCGAMKFNEMNVDYFEEEYKLYFVNENLATFVKNLVATYQKLV